MDPRPRNIFIAIALAAALAAVPPAHGARLPHGTPVTVAPTTFTWSRERSTGHPAGGFTYLALVNREGRASRTLVLLK